MSYPARSVVKAWSREAGRPFSIDPVSKGYHHPREQSPTSTIEPNRTCNDLPIRLQKAGTSRKWSYLDVSGSCGQSRPRCHAKCGEMSRPTPLARPSPCLPACQVLCLTYTTSENLSIVPVQFRTAETANERAGLLQGHGVQRLRLLPDVQGVPGLSQQPPASRDETTICM